MTLLPPEAVIQTAPPPNIQRPDVPDDTSPQGTPEKSGSGARTPATASECPALRRSRSVPDPTSRSEPPRRMRRQGRSFGGWHEIPKAQLDQLHQFSKSNSPVSVSETGASIDIKTACAVKREGEQITIPGFPIFPTPRHDIPDSGVPACGFGCSVRHSFGFRFQETIPLGISAPTVRYRAGRDRRSAGPPENRLRFLSFPRR